MKTMTTSPVRSKIAMAPAEMRQVTTTGTSSTDGTGGTTSGVDVTMIAADAIGSSALPA